MRRHEKITATFRLLTITLIFLPASSVFAQLPTGSKVPAGFRATKPENLPEELTVKCKIANQWYSVEIAATRLHFASPEEAQGVTEEVLKAAGYMPGVIRAKEALVGNAEICRSTETDYILYNPNWFKGLYQDTEERWADRAIFAHELGHYEHNDDRKGVGSTPENEAAADEYAGEILAKMGATLAQAQAAFNSDRMKAGSQGDHPPPPERLEAVKKGWTRVNPAPNKQSARQFLDSGLVFYFKKEYDRAIVDYTKAIEIDPTLAVAYNNRAIAYYKKQQYDKAIADYTKAIEIDPKFAAAYYNRGKAYYLKQEYDREITDFTKAIEIDPAYAAAYGDRGAAYDDKKEYDKAMADFTKAIEIDPTSATNYNNRGYVYFENEEYDKAIADFTKAIELDSTSAVTPVCWGCVPMPINIKLGSTSAATYNNRGNAYNSKQQYDKAIMDYTKAIEIDPTLAVAYNNRAKAYRALGKNELAELDERKVRDLASH